MQNGLPRSSLFKDPVSGLSHAAGLLLAVVGSAWLLGRTHDGATLATLAIYAGCLVALYAASSVYHLVRAGERVTRALRLLDHIAIFLFVAGTSTPVLFRALSGGTRVAALGAMWAAAAIGIAVKLGWRSAPRAVSTAIYVAMGWGVLAVARSLFTGLPPWSVTLVIAGGVVYTLGALVYARKWPNPRPPTFGFHEVWHFFVLGGSALHFAAIALLPS